MLCELQKTLQKTILLVPHDPRATRRAHRILHLEKGQLVEAQTPPAETAIREAHVEAIRKDN